MKFYANIYKNRRRVPAACVYKAAVLVVVLFRNSQVLSAGQLPRQLRRLMDQDGQVLGANPEVTLLIFYLYQRHLVAVLATVYTGSQMHIHINLQSR
jgi:hypothetical protein